MTRTATTTRNATHVRARRRRRLEPEPEPRTENDMARRPRHDGTLAAVAFLATLLGLMGPDAYHASVFARAQYVGQAGRRRSVGTGTLDRVTIDNSVFMKNGKEFHFIGFNQYYMLDKARLPAERHIVDETLKDAADLGMNVMRTWAFDDRPHGLQIMPGVFDEETFRALDYVLDASAKHGVHVILALVNYWSDYGGMESYVKWCTQSPTIANHTVSEFYTNPMCR